LPLLDQSKVEDQEDLLSVKSILDSFKPDYLSVNWKSGEMSKTIDEVVITAKDLENWRWGQLFIDKLTDKSFKLIFKIDPGLKIGDPDSSPAANFDFIKKRLTINSEDLELKIDITPPSLNQTEEEKNKELYVRVLSNYDFIATSLHNFKMRLQHELAHAFQHYEKYQLDTKTPITYGLPPKFKSKYDPRGFSTGLPRQLHPFRPIEVYPRLINSIEEFKKIIPTIPKEEHSKFIREFMGIDGITPNTNINFKDFLEKLETLNEELSYIPEEELESIDPKIFQFENKIYQTMVKKFLSEIYKLGYQI